MTRHHVTPEVQISRLEHRVADLEKRNADLEAAKLRAEETAVAHAAFALMVADLDRNENGRHERDVDYGTPGGVSTGNPLLPTGTTLGYSIGARWRYVVPPPEQRHDPQAWKVKNS